MADLPIMLRVEGKHCVVVGGGPVAYRRAQALLDAGAQVTVIAPDMDPRFHDLGTVIERREYRCSDLDQAILVITATDDRAVNNTVAADAAMAGVLVNRADEPITGDFTVPAYSRHGPITVAVHTGGISAAAAATIRRQLSKALDVDWPVLLRIVEPYRRRVKQSTPRSGERRRKLKRLVAPAALQTLKDGGPEALSRFYDDLVGEPIPLASRKSGVVRASRPCANQQRISTASEHG